MEELGISYLADKKCNSMSGGEFQMVLMAKALAAEPKLLILDEPESNLDFKNQLVVLNAMSDLVHKKGMACIFNTHYPAHALQRASKALVLSKDGTSTFGDITEVVTEDMIRRSFGVEAIIGEVETPGNMVQSVIPISINQGDALANEALTPQADEDVIASLTILLPVSSYADKINKILHEYNGYIIGRMGMPYAKGGVKIIHVTLDSPRSVAAKLTQRLNVLPDVSVKCVYSKGDLA